MRLRFSLVAIAFVVALWWPQRSMAFMLSPAIMDVSMKAGESKGQVVTLGNDENQPIEYYFSIQKFIPRGEDGQQEFLPPSEIDGLPSWIKFDRASVILQPGEQRKIPFKLDIPGNAPPGGYYAVVFFSNIPPNREAVDHVETRPRTGMLLFVTVQGTVVEKLAWKDFSLVGGSTLSHLPAKFIARLENQGTVHQVPMGQIDVKNMFGQIVARLPLNASQNRIMPNSVRAYSASWQPQNTQEMNGFWSAIKAEWQNFAFGQYTATVSFITRSNPPLSSQTIAFAVWPWHLLSLVAGVFVFLMGGFAVRWHVRRSR